MPEHRSYVAYIFACLTQQVATGTRVRAMAIFHTAIQLAANTERPEIGTLWPLTGMACWN